jgi:hypothetical protein
MGNERARLYDHETALARGLQNGLLPHQVPALSGARITGRYLPTTAWMDNGGDLYDAIPSAHGIVLVVGDVEGHNPAAAATMGQLHSAVRAFAATGQQSAEVMAGINRRLLDLDPHQLASCCYAQINPDAAVADLVRADHCPPLLHGPDGATQILEVPGGPLLGIDHTSEYPQSKVPRSPGCILALLHLRPGRIPRCRHHRRHRPPAHPTGPRRRPVLGRPGRHHPGQRHPCREPDGRHRTAPDPVHPCPAEHIRRLVQPSSAPHSMPLGEPACL